MLSVLRAGPLTTVQDLGRPGYAHLGVPRSGALDPPAFSLANRLVGNPPSAACLEVTLGGLAVRSASTIVVAVTGAPAPVRVGSRPAPYGAPVHVPAGAVVALGRPAYGLRSYLAVSGGIAVSTVLGSRSTDTLSGLGPEVVRDGATLPLGTPTEPSTVDFVPALAACPCVLRLDAGPRVDWFTDDALEVLGGAPYTVRMESNRVGVRLAGPRLTRAVAGELPSEGIVLGAVQVPADGRPLVFLADHPTTGGYPVVGVVARDDLPLLAQARPGDTVTFRGPQQ